VYTLYDLFSSMSFLKLSSVGKKISGLYTVKDISFSQEPLQNIAIAGETGSGKTTLLKMIGGFVQPDEGEIKFEDIRIKGPDEKLLPGHPRIAYLSQHFELRNNYYVHEILEYANQLTDSEANILYSVCRIEHLLSRKTDQLSGGEKQRIALARLLISSPKLLLLDEPFSNLDAIHKEIIRSVIADLRERLQVSCIMVSHDAADVLAWADTIIVMKDGAVIQQSTPEKIYYNPVDEYCAALFGEYNLIDIQNNSVTRKLFLRPEDIFISPAETSLNGTVINVQFHGRYYCTQVQTAKELVKVFTNDKKIKPGDIVNLAFRDRTYWYL